MKPARVNRSFRVVVIFLAFIPCLAGQDVRWYNVTSFSVITTGGDLFSGLRSSFGYPLNSYLSVGGGAGLERFTGIPTYGPYSANLSLLPLFAEIRYTALKGRFSPVAAVNAGYKVLLNIPSSNIYSYTYTIFPGIAWNEYHEYDTYTRGGLFLTAELGVRGLIDTRWGIYLAAEYSVWAIGGDHHYWEYQYLAKPDGTEIKEFYSTSATLAYTHIFGIRVGFTFK